MIPAKLSISRMMVVIFLGLFLTVNYSAVTKHAPAFAQAISGPDKPMNGATPGGTTNSSSSDANLWRKIRQGDQGNVVGQNKYSGILIQSDGESWRNIRNGPLPMYSAWAILGILLLLSIFFAIRGRVKIEHGKSGRTIKRFALIDRASHW